MWYLLLLTQDDLRENMISVLNIAGVQYLAYRTGNLINFYDANKENACTLFPFGKGGVINTRAFTLLPKEEKAPAYSCEELGKTWFVSYKELCHV